MPPGTGPRHIILSGDNKFAYLLNESTPTEKQPRGFRIDPTGKYMVVSGELSDTISAYAIEANGALKPLGKYPTGKNSNWVERPAHIF
jgi:6-phosphogluconolactonase